MAAEIQRQMRLRTISFPSQLGLGALVFQKFGEARATIHSLTLPLANCFCNKKLFWWKMDTLPAVTDHRGMAKRPQKPRPLFIGQWVARLGRKPSEVAKAVGIGESYLSLLISGEKNNPSGRLLLDISEELGISVNDLYRRPPERDVTDQIAKLRPDQLAVLGDLLDELKPPKRK